MIKYNYYTDEIQTREDLAGKIFVFGSNLAGIHGAGAAKFARMHLGAKLGIGKGFTGDCFAIPTKGATLKTLTLNEIKTYIKFFKEVVHLNYELQFYVTKIGCGLAGYKDSEIAPLFKGSSSNCSFHIDWKPFLEEE